MKFGLNLYSLRDQIKTEEDFLDTSLRLREMGYSCIQFSGAPYDADVIRRVSEKSGMPVVLTHVSYDDLIHRTDELMSEHDSFGCRNIGIGGMGPRSCIEEDFLKRMTEEFNRVGEVMQKRGFAMYYHNHHYEFYKHGDMISYDYMIENGPFINFTLDTYWMQYGGACVTEYVEKLHGRIGCVHLKDYILTDDMVPTFAPVGDGVMNFKTIVPKMVASGTEFFIVEQDNAVDFPDPFDQVKRSIDYLRGEF